MQLGDKINIVYYCENVLEQGLLSAIQRISINQSINQYRNDYCNRTALNNEFVFQQDGAPAHRSHYTVAYLRSNVPEFIEP